MNRAVRSISQLLLLGLLATLITPLPAQAHVPAEPAAQTPNCGPMDVVFAVETSNGTGVPLSPQPSILTNFKSSFTSIVNDINTFSNGNMRLGLVVFTDTITIKNNLAANNDASVTTNVSALRAFDSKLAPEASDETLNTVVNRLGIRTGQVGDFSGTWRADATKLVLLIVDDGLPGGFTDTYGTTLGTNVANQSRTAGVIISSVSYPPGGSYDKDGYAALQRYANATSGVALRAASTSDVGASLRRIIANCGKRSDVYMRDSSSDIGNEPSSSNPIWGSPDIKPCHTRNCAQPENPVTGSTNYVYVTLRNSGPKATPPRLARGKLMLYYTGSGGAANWPTTEGAPNDWTLIGESGSITLNPSQVQTVEIPWNNIPASGHYCLLARWVSDDDPMTFPEGNNTLSNAYNNNNVIWRNVDVITLPRNILVQRAIALRNVSEDPVAMDVAIKPIGVSFLGQGVVELDLGTELFNGWDQGGRQGSNIQAIGGTRVRVTSSTGGELRFVLLSGLASPQLTVRLQANSTAATGLYTLHVVQYVQNETGRDETGGLAYEITVTP